MFAEQVANDRRTGATWLYPLMGTGVFFRIGRIVRFAEHFQFNRAFPQWLAGSNRSHCTLTDKCRFISPIAVREAIRAGWQAVQFTRHTQDKADVAIDRNGIHHPVPKTELMDLQAIPRSFAPLSRTARYYTDASCSRKCIVARRRTAALQCELDETSGT